MSRTHALPDARHQRLAGLRPWLLKMAEARVRNPQLAQDAVSETLMAGLQAPAEVLETDRLRAWLAGVLKNKLVDQLREYGPRALVVADDDIVLKTLDREAPGACPAEMASRRRFMRDLEAALGQLTAQQARCFLLREVQEASTSVISDELGITPENVWVSTHRARLRLRQLLAAWQC